jgi:hypothetical protein
MTELTSGAIPVTTAKTSLSSATDVNASPTCHTLLTCRVRHTGANLP